MLNLHEEFIKELRKRVPHRSELVSKISDILHIERESASRRLSEKVQFSVREMGLISRKLEISLDSMLYANTPYHWIPLILESPLDSRNLESLCVLMENTLAMMNEVVLQESPTEYGSTINALPLEYYIGYPHLRKFMFFKWGQYRIGTDDYNNFSTWELPDRIVQLNKIIKPLVNGIHHTMYIWDESLIWTLVGEINYFRKMNVISVEDMELIKKDLIDLLVRLEKHLKGTLKLDIHPQNLSFYISNINLGITCWYMFSEEQQLSSFNSHFISSANNNNLQGHTRLKNWINSFKNISVLISGSGELERRLFFAKQHNIIDSFLQ